MTFRNLLVLPALVCIASAASGSTLLRAAGATAPTKTRVWHFTSMLTLPPNRD